MDVGQGDDDDFFSLCKHLSDEESIGVYPGCKLLGGRADSEAALLKTLRTLFCNDRLFEHDAGRPVEASALEDTKFSLLRQMSALVGVQIRKMCEPVLLRIINAFCSHVEAHASKAGRRWSVDNPFFSVEVYAFPLRDEDRVIYIGWARWATDVC